MSTVLQQIFVFNSAPKYCRSNIRKNISRQYCGDIPAIKYCAREGGYKEPKLKDVRTWSRSLFSNNAKSQRIAQHFRNDQS